jgi:hypothetical protein
MCFALNILFGFELHQYYYSSNCLTVRYNMPLLTLTPISTLKMTQTKESKCIFNFKKFQQDDAVQYFIISCQSLYMFRAYRVPIIRSSINCTHSIWGRLTVCVQPLSWMSQNCIVRPAGRPHDTVTVPEVAYAVNFIDLLMMDTECVRNM